MSHASPTPLRFRRTRTLGYASLIAAALFVTASAVTAHFGLRANLPLELELTVSRGRLSIECTRLPQPRGLSAYTHQDGISLHFDGHYYNAMWWFVRIPLWSLAAFFVALAAWLLWLSRASRLWALEGRCTFCGYLMAGLPDATCPECGRRS